MEIETKKSSITLDTIVSEIFKWIGFAWTGLMIFLVLEFQAKISGSEQMTILKYNQEMYQFALNWAMVAAPAFIASYFGKR